MLQHKMKGGGMPITVLFSGPHFHFFIHKGIGRPEGFRPQVIGICIADDLFEEGMRVGREFGGHDTIADSGHRPGGQVSEVVLHDRDTSSFMTMALAIEVPNVMEPGGGADNKKVVWVQGIGAGYFLCMVDDTPGMREVVVGELGMRVKCCRYKTCNIRLYDTILHEW